MQMFRQDYDSVNRERAFAPTSAECRTQRVYMVNKRG